ncbi:MAG: PD-(D/E)XK nuclease family protein [Bythopirellula sp.]|nr:PD-(D/E)XK nuclease family protein [Bythopirellula sp.]
MPASLVNVILGPAKSGKTEHALARYGDFLAHWLADLTQPPGVWIGPTLSAINDVRDRLALAGEGALLAPRTTTFARLAEEIIAQGQRRIRPIGQLEKLRILTQLIRQLVAENQLRHFTAVALSPGFTRQVAEAIADLKRRDVWAEDFRERVRDDRERDFAQIYSAYQQHLHAHALYDAEGRFWAAREELEKISSPTRKRGEFRFGLIVLDGFADFTTAQHDLLRLLTAHSDELLITLPADHAEISPRELLFDKPMRTLEILEKSFPQLRREDASEAHYSSAGLQFVEDSLFREKGVRTILSAGGLSILAANSVQGEIREIARRIKESLLAGTATPDEIAVVFPAVHDVAPRVSEVFDDFGLPVALDCQQPLGTTPFARAASKLLQLHVEDWPFELLLDLVGNQHLNPPPSRVGLGEGDCRPALERSIRQAQLPAGRTLLVEQLRLWASWQANETDLSVERARLARDAAEALPVLENWERLLNTLPTRAPLADWVNHWEVVLRAFGIINEENLAHWRLFQNALATIQQADARLNAGGDQLNAQEFLDLWQNIAAAVPLTNSMEAVGCVRVFSAEAARTLAVKHLFLAGLSEQSYSSAEGTHRLYREQEVVRFTGDAGSSEKIAEQQTGEAMLLFYDVVTRASETLTLSYPALDDKGQALTPSPLLTELERALEPAKIPTTIMPPGQVVAADAVPLSRSGWRLNGMAAALEGKPEWLAGLASEPSTRTLGRAILHNITCVASRSERETFGPFEGLLLSPAARATLAQRYNVEHLWSPSQLETYAACPYQFFSKHILRLEPLAEIALRSDHLRRGNLLHQVLAAVHTQKEESTPTTDALVERFVQALADTIASAPLKGLEDALREIERREILAWAPQYAEQELAYRQRWQQFDQPLAPAYFEVRFGPKARGGSTSDAVSTLIPFTLDLGQEQIKLTGQIDRIDMGQIAGVTVFNIIDYKSGQEVKLTDKDMLAGRQLQLPLYALAAEKLLFADQQAVALATGYWSIKADGVKTMLEFRSHGEQGLAESTRWSELHTPIIERVAEIVHGIRSAEFPVYNENPECTRYCDFSKICRIAQIRSLEKVWLPLP